MPIEVVLRCRDCDAVMRVSPRVRDWPPCHACGSAQLELVHIGAPERVERATDDDEWKNTYDDWKTRTP